MANETIRLAEYAAGLRYEDLPAHVVQRAKDCITDTVAVIVLGNALPWSQIIAVTRKASAPVDTAASWGRAGRRCTRRRRPWPTGRWRTRSSPTI